MRPKKIHCGIGLKWELNERLTSFRIRHRYIPISFRCDRIILRGTDESVARKRRKTDGTNVRTDRALCRQFRAERLGVLRGAADADQSEPGALFPARRDFRRRWQDQF